MKAGLFELFPGPYGAEVARAALTRWLVEAALPLWSDRGVDRIEGGFVEKLDFDLQPLREPRRARVVARQIYVFATAARRGWLEGAAANAEHGLRFLFERVRQGDGRYASSVWPDGSVVRDTFDLYEHAFILFSLAQFGALPANHEGLADAAHGLLQHMQKNQHHPRAGFEESQPRTLPLKSNPHMHLFEAALAWCEVAPPRHRADWTALADELGQLALQQFVDPSSGALREYFDGQWQPMPGALGRVVEPGHQFEWAWLLTRWGVATRREHAVRAADRLRSIGEVHGIDEARDAALNELSDDFSVTDADAKLWPQTERVKAWCLAARLAPTREEALAACDHVARAAHAMAQFFVVSPAGLWREQWRRDGSFDSEPCRASSLYHIVGAIDTLHGCADLFASLVAPEQAPSHPRAAS